MTKTIEYYTKNNYGVNCGYPLDEKFYKAHQTLTKRVTINKEDIDAYKALGFEFTQVVNPHSEVLR